MKRIVSLMLALLAFSPSALAINPARFQNVPGVTLSYDPANPAAYSVKAGFNGVDSWAQYGGHLMVRYMNAGKQEDIPLILASFTTSGIPVSYMSVRTDARRYAVTCTDLVSAGLAEADNEGTLLITPSSVDMLRDVAGSAYAAVSVWNDGTETAFEFLVDDSARALLKLFIEEYDEQIAPRLGENATLRAVYDALTPSVRWENAEPIGDAVTEILTADYATLKSGSRGDEVKRLQQALIARGFLTGKADGVFGKNTAAAVKSYQQSAGLPRSGQADDATQTELYMSLVDVE